MTRVPANPPRTLLVRLGEWYSKRRFGTVLDPLKGMGHHAGVTIGYGVLEASALRWRKVDTRLKQLAVMASAARIGCEWCMDFGYWESREMGISHEKLRALPVWRDSDEFSELERLVLEYAEAMTDTPPAVTDELAGALRERLGEAGLVELTAMVALENVRSRLNAAWGLTGQGFKDRCELPGTGPGEAAGGPRARDSAQ